MKEKENSMFYRKVVLEIATSTNFAYSVSRCIVIYSGFFDEKFFNRKARQYRRAQKIFTR